MLTSSVAIEWLGLCMIGHEDGCTVLFANDPRIDRLMPPLDAQSVGTQMMKQLERAVPRFWDTVQVKEAKSPVKRHRWKVVLGEDIRARPEAYPAPDRTRSLECG